MAETEIIKEHKIVEKGDEWCVVSEDGSKSMGCYPSKEEAEKRLAQVEMHKHMSKDKKKKKEYQKSGRTSTVNGHWHEYGESDSRTGPPNDDSDDHTHPIVRNDSGEATSFGESDGHSHSGVDTLAMAKKPSILSKLKGLIDSELAGLDAKDELDDFEEYETKDGLPKSAWAYTPSDDPATWKLRIDDAAHVGGAAAALGKGFRGNKVSLPSDARSGVVAKVRAAWKKFHPDADESEMPSALKSNVEDAEAISELQTRIHNLQIKIYETPKTEDRALRGVEIFRTGDWNGDKYTDADLDHMVTAFNRVGFRPAIKLGHDKTIGGRAYGWVANLRRKGDRLLADFEDIPAEIMKTIREHGFDRVSSEIYWNFKRSGQTHPRVLRAVALLGHEPPAVADLAPLRSVLAVQGAEWERQLNYDVGELKMEKDDMTLDKLVSQVTELEQKLADAEKLKDDLEAAESESEEAGQKLEAAETQISELTEQLSEAKDGLKAAQKAKDTEIKDLKSQVEELTKKQLASEEAKRQERIHSKVKDCKIPAVQGEIAALYDLATSVERQVDFSADGGDAEKTDAEEIVDSLVKKFNELSKQLFKEFSFEEHKRSEGSDFTDASKEADKRVKEYMSKHEDADYASALMRVLDADPDLKRQYGQA